MAHSPLPFMWNEQLCAFQPLRRFARMAAERYGDGEVVTLVEHHDRSDASHRHEFAWIREAWKTLPDGLADQYPTPEALRKRALIQAGFYDEQIIDAGTKAAALRVATGVRARPGSDFSLVFVRDCFVIIRDAKSQSRRAMGAEQFQASKTGILTVIAEMLGTTPGALSKAEAA